MYFQDTYNLRPGDISEGKLSGMSFGTHLTANDCFELGRQSYNNGDHLHTVQVSISVIIPLFATSIILKGYYKTELYTRSFILVDE